MGMKSSLLYTEEKKQLRNSLIIENKNKFKKQLKRSTTTTTTTTDNKRIRHLVTTIDNNNNNNTSYSLTTKTSTGTDSSETTSSSNNGSKESTTVTDFTTTTPEILVSVLYEPSIGRPITAAAAGADNDIQFNQLEANYFGELCAAVGKQLMPYSSAVNVGHCGGDQPISVVDVDNKWDGIWILDQRLDKKIPGFVKMSKCLHAFRALTDNQIN
ncbi:uncharacterized protein LOC128954257 [Oppia nitens]|uniref:uncharacterized protein LOC128954257 n=1 Tax=Oppia nitens TaxID=1686743 RepID=UPI0023DA43D2|nr:uncharacterized protein LOC128954257 [Oppia nitens]